MKDICIKDNLKGYMEDNFSIWKIIYMEDNFLKIILYGR